MPGGQPLAESGEAGYALSGAVDGLVYRGVIQQLHTLQFVDAKGEHVVENGLASLAGDPGHEIGGVQRLTGVVQNFYRPPAGTNVTLNRVELSIVAGQSDSPAVTAAGQGWVVGIPVLARKTEQYGSDEGHQRTLPCLVGAVEHRDPATGEGESTLVEMPEPVQKQFFKPHVVSSSSTRAAKHSSSASDRRRPISSSEGMKSRSRSLISLREEYSG